MPRCLYILSIYILQSALDSVARFQEIKKHNFQIKKKNKKTVHHIRVVIVILSRSIM